MNETSALNEQQAIECIPWLLNGTLEGDEKRRIERWIADSPRVREELEKTHGIWQLHSAEPPTEDLVAYVEGRLDGESLEHMGAYLERSEAARLEVALLRQGKALMEAVAEGEIRLLARSEERDEPRASTPGTPSPSTGWLSMVAATLVGAIAASLLFWLASGPMAPQPPEQIAAGQLNVPIVEMLPTSGILRGDLTALPGVTLGAGDQRLVLILVSDTDPEAATLDVTASDAEGEVFWSGRGLVRDPRGEYTLGLTVPAHVDLLTLEVFARDAGRQQPIERYRLRIERLSAGVVP